MQFICMPVYPKNHKSEGQNPPRILPLKSFCSCKMLYVHPSCQISHDFRMFLFQMFCNNISLFCFIFITDQTAANNSFMKTIVCIELSFGIEFFITLITFIISDTKMFSQMCRIMVFKRISERAAGIQINWIFNIDIDIANFEKSILILILSNILLNIDIAQAIYCPKLKH